MIPIPHPPPFPTFIQRELTKPFRDMKLWTMKREKSIYFKISTEIINLPTEISSAKHHLFYVFICSFTVHLTLVIILRSFFSFASISFTRRGKTSTKQSNHHHFSSVNTSDTPYIFTYTSSEKTSRMYK